MDGACRWLGINHSPDGPCLVSFNLSNEGFFITLISSCCFDVYVEWINLVVLNRSIVLISYHENMTTFHISILGESDMKKSWTILFTVGPLPCVEHHIGLGTKEEIFFIRRDREVVWFD